MRHLTRCPSCGEFCGSGQPVCERCVARRSAAEDDGLRVSEGVWDTVIDALHDAFHDRRNDTRQIVPDQLAPQHVQPPTVNEA